MNKPKVAAKNDVLIGINRVLDNLKSIFQPAAVAVGAIHLPGGSSPNEAVVDDGRSQSSRRVLTNDAVAHARAQQFDASLGIEIGESEESGERGF